MESKRNGIQQQSEPRLSADNEGGASPFIVEFFMVQGIGFRCMAYRDHDGMWRSAFDNKALSGCIRILE
jgi:hypothetical protein